MMKRDCSSSARGSSLVIGRVQSNGMVVPFIIYVNCEHALFNNRFFIFILLEFSLCVFFLQFNSTQTHINVTCKSFI